MSKKKTPTRRSILKNRPLYIDDAYIYIKAVCEKSVVFENEVSRIRDRHDIKPIDKDNSDNAKLRRIDGDKLIVEDPSFHRVMTRFYIPEVLWPSLAKHIARFGKSSLLDDAISLISPTHQRKLFEAPYTFLPKFHATIPINVKKKDMEKLWKEIKKQQTQWMGGERPFAGSKAHWRTTEAFDSAFLVYEKLKGSKINMITAMEESRDFLQNLNPSRGNHYRLILDAEKQSNVKNDIIKIERGIAALSHFIGKR